ncbi:virulence factor SrfC family protein, partial [Azospirillum sp. B506]|uniref:virulence factor SrfC family protein n=1 Tax=Azospirillum sp. B506 TaxID=137721 RepID=UPI0005B2B9D8
MSESAMELVGAARRVAEGSGRARRWIEEVRPSAVSVANEAHGLTMATRKSENLARKLIGAAGRRNCVGVFGPSQAGKSYLVSALARSPSAGLTADFGSERRDFLTEINPPGDRESTGLVTRFTTHRDSPVDADHPVELRLLSETDLVKILANSFLSDFDPNNMTVKLPDEAEIRQILAAAEAEATLPPAAHLDEIVLYDLGEYFQRNFAARIRALDNTDYWEGVIRHAARLPLARRARLFAMLWGNLDAFTDLFVMLAGALDRLSHAPEARAALGALVPRDSSIIDVEVLKRGLGTPGDAQDLVSVRPLPSGGAAGPAVALPRATLTALVAELKIVMADRPWKFFEHTDLLDFPGARSRLKLPCLPSDAEERTAQVRELLLRGKIAYLFQRFTEERELTAMLLCMPPSTAEVKDLAPMVRSWIDVTHGATPEARARARTALFLVLTKFDLEFLEKGGETADSRRGKWDRRLGASFLELYGKDGWPENWERQPFAKRCS